MKRKDKTAQLDRTVLNVSALIEEAETIGPAYWHSRTPEERLQALELMRQRAYGYDPVTVRLQRVIEIVKLKNP
jgi:hypothetical protein